MCFGGDDGAAAVATSAANNATTVNTVDQTLNGGGFDAKGYLAANKDVTDAFNGMDPATRRAIGVNSAEDFAAWHYQHNGQAEGRSPTGNAPASGGIVNDAATTAQGIIDNTGENATKLVSTTQDAVSNQATTDAARWTELINNSNAASASALQTITDGFTNTITGLKNDNATLQTGLSDMLNQMNTAQGAFAAQLAAQQSAIEQEKRNIGQKARKPNLIELFRQNKERQSGGQSSTMITGPSGIGPIAATSGFLGANTLLGA